MTHSIIILRRYVYLEYCAELKIDGVSASLRYENGKLVRALSRGDGEFGDDITRHVMSSMCPDVPRELEGEGRESSYPAVFEIRGEMYVKEDALERFNEKKMQTEKRRLRTREMPPQESCA